MELIDHFWPLLIAAVVVGLSKGGLASLAAIAVPMLALIMNPVQAAAILLPVFIATDWVAVWTYRREVSWRNVAILVPGMLLGTITATIITPYTPESALLVFTGAIGLWYCARRWFTDSYDKKREAKVVPGLIWGWLTGITSFISHSGSPPSQAYLMPQQLPRMVFAGTIAIAFAIGNLMKLPGYYLLGQLNGLNWQVTAILAVAGGMGALAGRQIVKSLNEERFRLMIEVILFVLSVLLVGKGGMMML